ncbi:hypothetical protein [Candidatus Thiodictyon syntrophicum]|jgi:uncharacterized membrane protein|uniref:COG4648 family protein n=1 Tax=Candidatus Thiodictyon syntrophicum TaxID=1166950 RepID=UPI001C129E2E|nr:hypothetical protein [Candidatus Thiodictyon syntrophicum]
MSLTPVGVVRRGAIAIGVFAYPVLAHYSTATSAANSFPALGLTVALAPVLVIAVWLAWRSPRRFAMLVLCATAGCLLWFYRDTLEQHFGWVYFSQHAGIYVLLGAAFGLSLGRGQAPLCTRFAQALRGSLSPEVARYTRQVTLAWTLLFLGISLVSTLLFLFSGIAVWSVFANFLSPLLIALMFVVEHLVRRRRLPDLEQHGIMDSILAFRSTPTVCPGASVHSPIARARRKGSDGPNAPTWPWRA